MNEELKPVPDFDARGILARIIDKGADLLTYGSFSQRNPLLGKMRNCPFCGQRRRGGNTTELCCHAKYIWENPAKDAKPKVRGRSNPRLTRRNPPLFLMRQILRDIEKNPEIAAGMQCEMLSRLGRIPRELVKDEVTREKVYREKLIEPHHMAAFVERYLLWKQKRANRSKRRQQKLSRRVNRGAR